jgi:hypothetical protein
LVAPAGPAAFSGSVDVSDFSDYAGGESNAFLLVASNFGDSSTSPRREPKDPKVVACLRFTLSYRDLEDLFAERCVDGPIKRYGDGS